MPTVTGSWVPNSTSNQRMRLVIEYDLTLTATTARCDGEVYIEVRYGLSDTNNTFTASGSLTNAVNTSKTISVPTNGRQKIHSWSTTVARGSSATSRAMNFALTGVEYVGAGQKASVSETISIPAVPAPKTPGSVKVARQSLTQVRVTWTGGAVSSVQVSRRSVQGSATASWESYATVTPASSTTALADINVATGYEYRARVRRTQEGVHSDWGSSSNTARLFDKPPAPTGVSVAAPDPAAKRTSSWTLTDTASTRATGQQVARWTQSGGDWAAPSTVAASARSHVDSTKIPNDRVRYRIRAVNAAGESAWVTTGYVSTMPAAATNPVVERSGVTDVVVSCINRALSSQAKIDIYAASSTDGLTWSTAAPVTGHTGIAAGAVGAVITRTITGLDQAKRWRFYAVTWVQEPTLLQVWSGASSPVLITQPPAPPKAVAPVTTQRAGAPVAFQWVHQAMDGSAQHAAEVQYTLNAGATWTTLVVTGDAQEVTTATSIGAGELGWHARTRGIHASYGERCGVVYVQVADPPAVGITGIGPEWPSNKMVAELTFADVAAPTRYVAVLRNGLNQPIETISAAWPAADPTRARVVFATVLADGEQYSVYATVTSGTGLSATAGTAPTTVAFRPPGAPQVSAVWDLDTATVQLAVANDQRATAWEGVAGRSASVETVDAVVTRRNLATNPRLTDTYGSVARPEDEGPVPGIRRLGGDAAVMTAAANARAYIEGGYAVCDLRLVTSEAGAIYPTGTSTGDATGVSLARMGCVLDQWTAIRVEYSQDDTLTGVEHPNARRITVGTRLDTGVVDLNVHVSNQAPNQAQEDTVLTVVFLASSAGGVVDYVPRLLAGHQDLSARTRWRRMVIAQADTETEARAAVDSYFDGGTITTTAATRVERSRDLIVWETLAEGLDLDATLTDPWAPFVAAMHYRAVAASDLGAETIGDVATISTMSDHLWLTAEDGRSVRCRANLKPSWSLGHQVVTEQYHGRALPEAHYGEARPRTWRYTASLFPGDGLGQDWSIILGGDVLMRNPEGDRAWVTIAAEGPDLTGHWIAHHDISLAMSAVDHNETIGGVVGG